ncbi:hypothetical protein EVAR_3287_1 [Eumeta japonica]|uniref:Uncharacterized protein n=1 Tax=Eumeta variegata TaxID=151549 RepID=A0A4C1SUY6_EUMVA|nr:hypothetical protein EVAR_3287_1 [Eumeta japonica]
MLDVIKKLLSLPSVSQHMLTDVDRLPAMQVGDFLLHIELDEPRPEVLEIARRELRETPDVVAPAIDKLKALLQKFKGIVARNNAESFAVDLQANQFRNTRAATPTKPRIFQTVTVLATNVRCNKSVLYSARRRLVDINIVSPEKLQKREFWIWERKRKVELALERGAALEGDRPVKEGWGYVLKKIFRYRIRNVSADDLFSEFLAQLESNHLTCSPYAGGHLKPSVPDIIAESTTTTDDRPQLAMGEVVAMNSKLLNLKQTKMDCSTE